MNETSFDSRSSWLKNRVNLPTTLSSKAISERLKPKIRAQAFFSARVAEARILEAIKEISDQYSMGEIELAEARTALKRLAVGNKLDDGSGSLKNLGSLARIDLILQQNALMAAAVGQYEAGMDPDIKERFPCWRYIASTAVNPRDSHAKYSGMVFSKDDPIWHKIFPPWDFNCKCSVEDCDDEPIAPEQTKKLIPQGEVESGFAFDPAHAFEEFDIASVKSSALKAKIIDECEMCFGDQIIKGADGKLHFEHKEQYSSWDEHGLESAKTWLAAPSPGKVDPNKSKEKLEKGFAVATGDGRIAILDRAVLDHWMTEENKLQTDIDSRLASLDYAIETLKHPQERWDQDTQCRYLKAFQKKTGGFEGCMVCITDDNKCRTYFVPSVKALDKMRKGKSCQIFKVALSTGHNATQTTATVAVPNRSDSSDN